MTEDSKRKKILIVDDEPDILKTASFILDKAGYDVVTAGDGTEAIAAVKKEKFDLILLDVVMPGVDGFSFLKMIRSDPGTKDVPILVVSGRPGMAGTFMSFGADGFIVKPMDPVTLVAEADRYTKHRAMLMTESPFLTEKISKIFKKEDHEVCVVPNESELKQKGGENRYRCVVAHLACVDSDPEKFREMVVGSLMFKDPALVIYSDSSVHGLENNNTVAIGEESAKWARAGVKKFYDPRTVIQPLSSVLRSWVF
jgi:CheY-like chemotaxis protein